MIPFTVPVNVGDANGANPLIADKFALRSNAVCCAVLTGLFASLVFVTFPKPTIEAVIPLTVPVNVGDANGAFNARPGTVGDAAVPPKSPAN